MKLNAKMIGLAMLLLALLPSVVKAQDFTDKDTLRYVDAMHYRLINWAFDRTLKSRIPLEFYGQVRPTLWDRASCTSGKAIRFATNSTAVAAATARCALTTTSVRVRIPSRARSMWTGSTARCTNI